MTVVSPSQITASFAIASNAASGAATVTVSTSNGTTSPVTFTVLVPAVFTPIRVNSGGPAFTDPLGQVWSADYGSVNGGAWGKVVPVYSTNTPTLYQTENHGSSLAYTFSVPNGNYLVNLKFAEIFYTAAGLRVFNVSHQRPDRPLQLRYRRPGRRRLHRRRPPVPGHRHGGADRHPIPPCDLYPKVDAIEILNPAPPAPTVSSISPANASVGASVPVTINGTNLNAAVVVSAGPNIKVSNVTVVSATQITATFAISATAATGATNVTVTTAGGTSGAKHHLQFNSAHI